MIQRNHLKRNKVKIVKPSDLDNKKIVLDGCMVTYTGTIFNLMDPDPDLIDIRDIAHGLAFNCRWNGATKDFYSIAEHSIRVLIRCRPDKDRELSGLFHDAEEAYWGDIIKPLKEIIKINSPEVLQKMVDLRMLIFDKFHLKYVDVAKEDFDELLWDFNNLILTKSFKTWSPNEAEQRWLGHWEYYSHFL
jgi:hypothetical protein